MEGTWAPTQAGLKTRLYDYQLPAIAYRLFRNIMMSVSTMLTRIDVASGK